MRTAAAAAMLMALTACTMKNQDAPPLTGPSEQGTSLQLIANPDVLTQDGGSQSAITVIARGPNGQPLASLSIRADVTSNGAVTDAMGRLSARNIVTDGNGRADVVYTAPLSKTVNETSVAIQFIPVGTDAANSLPRSVKIRLLPQGTVGGNDGLNPQFVFSPTSPGNEEPVLFEACTDASNPCALANNPVTSYSWNFGDGRHASGRTVTHSFDKSGDYTVTLTITDGYARSASHSEQISVGQGQAPSATFTASPSSALPGGDIFFNASQSKPATGRTISKYTWDFGDGTTGSGAKVTHSYSAVGSYTVLLIVTDDAGRTGSATRTITVSTGTPPTADFTFSPGGTVGSSINFDGTTSVAASGRTIVSYTWSWGDATANGNGATASHVFSSAGDFEVRLTVVDDVGSVASITKTVTVTP